MEIRTESEGRESQTILVPRILCHLVLFIDCIRNKNILFRNATISTN